MRFVLILIALFLTACGSEKRRTGRSHIVFGDSIAFGTGTSTARHDLAHCLAGKTNSVYINRGVPGETTRAVRARLPEVLALRPSVVVLSAGGNDLLTNLGSWASKGERFTVDETLENIRAIFSAFRDAGARVYYIDMEPPLISRSDSLAAHWDGRLARVREQAAQFGNVTVVDNAMRGLWLSPEHMSDNIHPNDSGYAQMCQNIYARMLQ